MDVIYTAGPQAWKVRLVQGMAVVCTPVALWAGWEIARSYGLHPSEGGELASLGVRLALGGSVAALGVFFLVGMWIYGRCYVMEAAVDEARGVLGITLAGLPLRRRMEVPLDDVKGSRYHIGHTDTGKITVSAPWSSVRLRGRRLPLIVDGQGDFRDPELIAEHLFRE
ncbi:MAG TPA: hypothetical protein VM759_08795, partial [Longimicrobium sp.]|nr:hypothetical protein [Longimicrobium sp.]